MPDFLSHLTHFHGSLDYDVRFPVNPDASNNGHTPARGSKWITTQTRELTYRFHAHFHPYVQELIAELVEKSIAGLQAADTATEEGQPKKFQFYEDFFSEYQPNEELIPNEIKDAKGTVLSSDLHPAKALDFKSGGAYSVYNWELFFHVPFTIALHLSKNQRYEEALRWFHYIFDPGDDSDDSTPERFWKVKPFRKTDLRLIEETMVNLSSKADSELVRETINSIEAWRNAPFRPHLIARFRPEAYMLKTVMAYLDNLIAWGDSLFRQDTGEAINEAAQLYVLAANILGPRPQAVPRKGTLKPQTYAQMKGDLDAFGNTLRELEVELPFNLLPPPQTSSEERGTITLHSIGQSLYFCIPRNPKLLGYWDTVADRLYKIRNSLSLKGVFRQLPLFEPPIDPAMLARAAAAGLDVGAVISGLNQPLPLVRFRVMVQKATEICQEVKSLGAGILSAIEKEDGEALSVLRAKHETNIQQLAEGIRYAQWQEAIKVREGLEVSLTNAIARYSYYENLLGNTSADVPALPSLDTSSLDDKKFTSEEPTLGKRDVNYDNFQGALNAVGLDELDALNLNTPEALSLILNNQSIDFQTVALVMEYAGGILSMIPEVGAEVTPLGVGAGIRAAGIHFAKALQLYAGATRGLEGIIRTKAGISSTVGNFRRRTQGWEQQSQQAAGEINNIYKQLVAAQIREHISQKEYENHQTQIRQAQEMEHFLAGEKVDALEGHAKTTTQGFYAYLRREVTSLHSKYFKFAYDVAKKAEIALQHELGKSDLSLVQFDYLSGKEGLYAGEKLAFDIKRMELTYFDMNARELELTKHISLLQVSPQSLLQLRLTGQCSVRLPEEVFDMGGCEGHYFRRIKSVALSIPCVVGPYVSVNATLTLTKSSIRTKANLLGKPDDPASYREQENDDRFSHHHSTTSIVTSDAQNDRGMFEFNLNDERYLPFEYAGAISEWRLELAQAQAQAEEFPQFDYQTISDVIFHINYTARQAGGLLKQGALTNLRHLVKESGTWQMLSLKQMFPSAWHQFTTSNQDENGSFLLSFELLPEHYPFWSNALRKDIAEIKLHAFSSAEVTITHPEEAGSFELVKDGQLGENVYSGIWEKTLSATGSITLLLSRNDLQDMWMSIRWIKKPES